MDIHSLIRGIYKAAELFPINNKKSNPQNRKMAEALSQEIIDLIHQQCDKSFTAYKNEATPE